MLNDYYNSVLIKQIDVSSIDANAIGIFISHLTTPFITDSTHSHRIILKARENDFEELFNLVEIIIGAAVMCEHKAEFIPRIFSLDEDSQAVLKASIENVRRYSFNQS
jgi:hypothetical protein